MKAADWIDQVKEAKGWASDYRVAKELGLSKNTISNYRGGTRTLDDETAARVAEVLGLEPHIIVIDQVAERTKVDSVRASISDLLVRLSGKNPVAGSGGAAAPACAERAPVDITSVTPNSAPPAKKAGEPDSLQRNKHRVNWIVSAKRMMGGLLPPAPPALA